ncbi:pyridoxal phosphate-dependent aminotransferase [Clostridiales bacterium COT073_COT-073]|nr:pyridoxal phosphate-dependent aminotransferase [Clostridiales bacterium COT073_COT-073]
MKKKISKRALAVSPSTTLEITARAAELKNAGKDVISFGAGEPDFDTPEAIKVAAISALNEGFTKYTATPGILPLREKLAEKLKKENGLNYTGNQIIVTNGGKQALYNVLQAILDEQDEVLLFAPYWLSYPEMIRLAGGKPVVVDTCLPEKYYPNLQAVRARITNKTKAMIVNSPCNPTGAVYTDEILKGLAEIANEFDLWVISDEIYEKLIYNGRKFRSIASLGEDIFARTIVINGFSKAYSMTGWRLGYAAGDREVIAAMTRIQSHQTSNINSITQKAALAALDDMDISAMIETFDKRRSYMVNYLKTIAEVKFAEPEGAFYVLLDLREFLEKHQITAKQMAQDLLEKSYVAVVPADDFGIAGHIRLSYPISIEKMEIGLKRLKEYLESR